MSNTDQGSPVALVTGSGRGIGLACARALAADGHDVCLNCSSDSSFERTSAAAEEIANEYGVRTLAVVANVADTEAAKALVDEAVAELGRIDVLVNNAGITRDGLIARMGEDDFDAVIDVNLKGTFNCCKAASKYMMKQRSGAIVNMSSIVGIAGNAGQANYAASKAGVIGLTKSLAKELAPSNIQVNAIACGVIDTAMNHCFSPEDMEALKAEIPADRLGTPEEVASLVFQTANAPGFLTGQVITMDGGWY